MNEKVLLYNDGCMESSYHFMEDVVIIEQNDVEENGEKNFVAVEIANIRRILLDYDLNHSKDEEE